MLVKVLIAAVLIVGGIVAFIATRPAEFSVSRSATTSAPPSAVFAQVNDFHKWDAWSPWAKRDPNMKTTHEGPASGVGAMYSWNGNKDVGEGRMTILESIPDELIRIKLEFIKPFAATNTTVFTFKPRNNGTEITWTMSGQNNFMAKAFQLVMSMDKIVGGDFEKGLAQMTAVAESAS
ncbi:MAG: SRPBCC family protein [Candidatus Hydrogenedentes bacterium]|nr:SRPBCC family protein [Candidatus Hydrogenedentota bacterium]